MRKGFFMLEEKILDLVKRYHGACKKNEKKIEKVHYAGRCYDETEMVAAVKNLLAFTLTYGKDCMQFEKELAQFLEMKKTFVVNSGSSANLLAVSALCSKQLKDLALKPGDEVIVPAASFPTTVAPIIQHGLVPVFIDTQLGFYNPDVETIKSAVGSKTRAVMFAHALGNPAQIDKIRDFCKKQSLYLIEDCCDALGSTYHGKMLGSFADISTYSFYPAHHITMGEGGAVATNNDDLYKAVHSLRSWGKHCWCKPGEVNNLGACKSRFNLQFKDLPFGYDHKYVYTEIGYNLKPLDVQCAIGRVQLKKVNAFNQKRKENFTILYDFFKKYEDLFILPQSLPHTDPAWFAFILTVREGVTISRRDLVMHLESQGIETRPLFAGNIVRQPAFQNITCRIFGNLYNADLIMNNSFFVGLYPGITQDHLDKMINSFELFFNKKYKNKLFEQGYGL
jgi:CDP-6-deoxy-D-xylo-4-hexulose-3-dehydrase